MKAEAGISLFVLFLLIYEFNGGGIINDLTKIFAAAIEAAGGYDMYKIMSAFDNTAYCCSDDDEANWLPVWENIEGKSVFYAFISQYYPAALVKDNCPGPVKNILKYNRILMGRFEEPFSCDEGVLKKYVRSGQIIIDDRFLDNGDFSPDDEQLFWIYQCLEHHREYVTPYNFTLNEVRY